MSTPAQPDNDTLSESAHAGEPEPAASGRTPHPQEPAEGPDSDD